MAKNVMEIRSLKKHETVAVEYLPLPRFKTKYLHKLAGGIISIKFPIITIWLTDMLPAFRIGWKLFYLFISQTRQHFEKMNITENTHLIPIKDPLFSCCVYHQFEDDSVYANWNKWFALSQATQCPSSMDASK